MRSSTPGRIERSDTQTPLSPVVTTVACTGRPCATSTALESPRPGPSESRRRLPSIWLRIHSEPNPVARLVVPTPTFTSGFSRLPVLTRSEEHTSELQSRLHLVCRLL